MERYSIEEILQASVVIPQEQTPWGEAVLTSKDGRYYFCLAGKYCREVDGGDSFTLTQIARWTLVTEQLSKKKQQMRVPIQGIIRAVGLEPVDVEKFLDNEGKNGLVGKLRQLPWYQNAHPEIKTAVIKLFAHLGLFEPTKIEDRLSVVEKVIAHFSLLEIHNLFGGLSPGVDLKSILDRQGFEKAWRQKFDPDGKKAISFFLSHLSCKGFKEVASYVLGNFAGICHQHETHKKAAITRLENQALSSSDREIVTLAQRVSTQKNAVASAMHSSGGNIKEEQAKLYRLRQHLYARVRHSSDLALKKQQLEVDEFGSKLRLQDVIGYHDDTTIKANIPEEMKVLALQAGYHGCDDWELSRLGEIYQASFSAPAKYFVLEQKDNCVDEPYFYEWLAPNKPELYFAAMLCGNTCMRPGFAGEAALWECALSPDVAICLIKDRTNQPVAYFRVNYDTTAQGFYLDTVESRLNFVLNSEQIWQVVYRAVVDMATAMNSRGEHLVRVINFRHDLGNRLKVQWSRLPLSPITLAGKTYHHQAVAWTYGDSDPRVQKLVWKLQEKPLVIVADNLLSTGANAQVYKIEGQRIIKVFACDYSSEKVFAECQNSILLQSLGLPVPQCFGIRQTQDGLGIVYEHIDGETLTQVIKNCPAKANQLVSRMTDLIRKFHQVVLKDKPLPQAKEKYASHLDRCHDYLSDAELTTFKQLLASIPDANNLIHGDFHTGNVMLRPDGQLMAIDFAEVCLGHPIFDLIAEGAVVPLSDGFDKFLVETYLGISAKLIGEIWTDYVKYYCRSTHTKHLAKQGRLVACLRNVVTPDITHGIPQGELVKYIRDIAKILTDNLYAWQEIDWNCWR